MTKMNRKEFFKLMATGVGGAILTACRPGSTKGGGSVPVPNGYEFYPLLGTGDELPSGTTAEKLSPVIMINDHDEVIVHCHDSDGVHGVFEYTIDYSGKKPTIAQSRKILREGDVLQDGVTADHFHVGGTNKHGSFAIRVSSNANGIAKIYLERDKGGLVPVLTPHDALPGGAGRFAASFGDLDLDDTDSFLLASHYLPEGESTPKEGIFHLAGGAVKIGGSLLLSSGDLVSGAGTNVNRIGLIDVSSEGDDFVAQITCGTPLGMTRKPGTGGKPGENTAVVYGSVRQPARRGLRSASRSIRLSRATALAALRGDVLYGPRIGGDRNIGHIVQTGENNLELYLDDLRVLGIGDLTPMNNTVTGFSGPIIGSDGLLHFCVMTDHGAEICLFDRSSVHSVITAGAKIPAHGERIVGLDFGSVRNMVDSEGRLVFLATLESGKKSVVLGIPV